MFFSVDGGWKRNSDSGEMMLLLLSLPLLRPREIHRRSAFAVIEVPVRWWEGWMDGWMDRYNEIGDGSFLSSAVQWSDEQR